MRGGGERARRSSAHDRFRGTDAYRAEREWERYEGTAQRELFRALRDRFVRRHVLPRGAAVDLGSGPGRFLPALASRGARPVALDLSREMLVALGRHAADSGSADLVRGDARRPPLAVGGFATVALLGNTLGFEDADGPGLLAHAVGLVEPDGVLLVELAPGPGERSRYLGRLPPGAVGRLLAAPPAAILPRLEREGFVRVPERHRPHGFRRWTVPELLRAAGIGAAVEALAVAPCLGADPTRVGEVARDPRAWDRLLELEERVGRSSARWPSAAAVLVALRSRGVRQNAFERGDDSFRPTDAEEGGGRRLARRRSAPRRPGRPRYGEA